MIIIYFVNKMISVQSFKLHHPFTAKICGPTQSGKSTFLKQILYKNQSLIEPAPERIVYCYAKWSDGFNDLKQVTPYIEFVEGLPDISQFNSQQNNLLILDDLMNEAEQNKSILELFTTDSHHSNISVFLTSQNIFSQGKYARTISLNCHYLIILNNPRDKAQVHHLARQMFPTNSQYLIECYEDATQQKYGYLFLDFKQSTDNKHRVQSGITYDSTRIIYIPK